MRAVPLDEGLARSLVEAAPDVLLLVDEEGRIVFANARVEPMFGYARGELVGQPVEVLMPRRFREAHVAHREGFVKSGRMHPMGDFRRDVVGLRRDGTEFPVEVSLNLVRMPRCTFVVAAVRDATKRREDERALREAEERFRLAFDEAPIGVALVALDGRFLRVNRALARIVGYSAEELTGLTFQAITHPEDLDADVEIARKLATGELPQVQFGKRYVRKDGSVVDAMVSSTAMRDRDGAALYYLTQIEDVTERKRADEALRRSEEGLREAQRVAQMGSWDWDLLTNEVVRSKEIYAVYGVEPSPQYAKPYSFSPLIHPDDRDRVVKTIERAVREGGPFRVEHRIIRPDGAERVLVQQAEVLTKDGRPVRLVATIRDVTDRKRIEAEREESLRWMRAVLEQSPVGLLLVYGPNGERLEANRRAQEMLGRPLHTIAQYADTLCAPDGRPLGRDELPAARALRGERIVDGEYLLHDAAGGSTPVLASAGPIIGRSGAVLGAVVAFRDIKAAKELERLRAEWGSVVAHDLRQPLGSISLSAQLLARTAGDPALLKHVERIRAAANRLNRMVGDLMNLSRVEARRLELARQRVDVPALVNASVERMALEAPDRPFDVRAADVPEAEGDPDRIAQVVDNLLTNAVKYGKPGTPIVVTVGRDGGEVAVAVTNEGSPLDPQELSRLFERFQRTASAKMAGIQGVGLGLYIARSLVEAHGGRISAQSTPGGVNTFRFTLPVASRA